MQHAFRCMLNGISGLVVQCIVAIDVTRVRFLADALFLALRGPFLSRGAMSKQARELRLSPPVPPDERLHIGRQSLANPKREA